MTSLKTIATISFAALLLSTSLANADARSNLHIVFGDRTTAAVSAGGDVPASSNPGGGRLQTDIELPPLKDVGKPLSKDGGGLIDPTIDPKADPNVDPKADPGVDPKVEPKASPAEIITAGGLKLSPHSLKCWITDNGWIWFKNIGTETIPAGSMMMIKWPDGTTTMFKVDDDLKAGAGFDISIPASVLAAADGTHCSASIKI